MRLLLIASGDEAIPASVSSPMLATGTAPLSGLPRSFRFSRRGSRADHMNRRQVICRPNR